MVIPGLFLDLPGLSAGSYVQALLSWPHFRQAFRLSRPLTPELSRPKRIDLVTSVSIFGPFVGMATFDFIEPHLQPSASEALLHTIVFEGTWGTLTKTPAKGSLRRSCEGKHRMLPSGFYWKKAKKNVEAMSKHSHSAKAARNHPAIFMLHCTSGWRFGLLGPRHLGLQPLKQVCGRRLRGFGGVHGMSQAVAEIRAGAVPSPARRLCRCAGDVSCPDFGRKSQSFASELKWTVVVSCESVSFWVTLPTNRRHRKIELLGSLSSAPEGPPVQRL